MPLGSPAKRICVRGSSPSGPPSDPLEQQVDALVDWLMEEPAAEAALHHLPPRAPDRAAPPEEPLQPHRKMELLDRETQLLADASSQTTPWQEVMQDLTESAAATPMRNWRGAKRSNTT